MQAVLTRRERLAVDENVVIHTEKRCFIGSGPPNVSPRNERSVFRAIVAIVERGFAGSWLGPIAIDLSAKYRRTAVGHRNLGRAECLRNGRLLAAAGCRRTDLRTDRHGGDQNNEK